MILFEIKGWLHETDNLKTLEMEVFVLFFVKDSDPFKEGLGVLKKSFAFSFSLNRLEIVF